jgi:hypothetical protein
MTYQSGSLGKIQKGDINGFLNTNTPNFNGLWSTGSGDSGYGQTAIAAVAAGDKVSATTWKNLIDNITKMANHQGTSITSMTNSSSPPPAPPSPHDNTWLANNTLPGTGKTIRIIANNTPAIITNNLTALTTNRLNSAATPRSTTNTTLTSSSSWTDSFTATFTVNFPSADAIRYYFNAGGQIGIQSSHPDTANINRLISEICSCMGTLWISSPASGTVNIEGSSWTGVKQVGSIGTGGGVTLNTGSGFYSLSGSDTILITQKGSFSYTGSSNSGNYNTNTFGRISARTSGNTITITLVIDEVPNGAIVSANTTATLILKPPSSTYLSPSWGSISAGTITITKSLSAT